MAKEQKTERLYIRITKKNLNRIKTLALTYSNGDITSWVTYAAINADRKILKKSPAKSRSSQKGI